MKHKSTLTLALAIAAALPATPAMSQNSTPQTTSPATTPAAATLTLTRLNCGTLVDQDLAPYNDALEREGVRGTLTDSCYLIRHGDQYLLWDTGLPARFLRRAPDPADNNSTQDRSVVEQLAQLGIRPEQNSFIGVSHYHWDHTGAIVDFPNATLLIGARDFLALQGTDDAPGLERGVFAHWLTGGGKVEQVALDHDVFGDGTVRILNTPGHTPGHTALLVRLANSGNYLLTGDLYHYSFNREHRGVPVFNTSRAETLASFDRFEQIARQLSATVIIQHEAGDIGKLPAFPASAN